MATKKEHAYTGKQRLVLVNGVPMFEAETSTYTPSENSDEALTIKQAEALIVRLTKEDAGHAFAWNGERIKRLKAQVKRQKANQRARERRAAKRAEKQA